MTERNPRGRTTKMLLSRVDADGEHRRPDELIVEEPLSIQLDGTLVATTMRTPGHDYELAVGFLHAEGLLGGAAVRGVRYCADGSAVESQFNVVTVETGGAAPTPTPRLGSTSSSCGLCGSEAIDTLTERLTPFDDDQFDPALLIDIAERVKGKQELFDKTGAAHAAASFDRTGTILLVREDIGRHNAVDKIVGRMLLDGELPGPEGGFGLYVSGRSSFEMVQKAWAGGFSSLVSVSAPSALAVDTANAANMQLAGFIRAGAINIYSRHGVGPS